MDWAEAPYSYLCPLELLANYLVLTKDSVIMVYLEWHLSRALKIEGDGDKGEWIFLGGRAWTLIPPYLDIRIIWGSFKKWGCLSPTPRNSALFGLEWGLRVGLFLKPLPPPNAIPTCTWVCYPQLHDDSVIRWLRHTPCNCPKFTGSSSRWLWDHRLSLMS